MRRAKEKILKESKDRREAQLAIAKLGSEGFTDMPDKLLASYQSFSSAEQRTSPDFKKREEEMTKLREYKNDFLNYFEMKLTKAGADMGDPTAAASMSGNQNSQMKLPKRRKLQRDDSVEAIA